MSCNTTPLTLNSFKNKLRKLKATSMPVAPHHFMQRFQLITKIKQFRLWKSSLNLCWRKSWIMRSKSSKSEPPTQTLISPLMPLLITSRLQRTLTNAALNSWKKTMLRVVCGSIRLKVTTKFWKHLSYTWPLSQPTTNNRGANSLPSLTTTCSGLEPKRLSLETLKV